MRTVLIVSRYFPPMFDVGGKRAYRFARYLPEHGWRAVVWTSQPPPDRPVDPTPVELPAGTVVARDFLPTWRREPSSHLSDGTDTRPVKRQRKDQAPARRLRWPVDANVWLAPRQAMALRALAREHRAEAIFATSSPYSTLVFGAAAKAATGLPLILDLRDPWTLNFLHARRPQWVRRVDRAVERTCFQLADKVLFTCDSAAEAYRQLYPELPPDRIGAITNSFDPAQRPARVSPEGPVRIVHFGNCYGVRTMAPVLRAMAMVRDARGALDGMKIINLGRVAEEDLALAAELGLAEHFEHRAMVPYAEGLEILAGADLQLLLAYGDETLFIPAKFFDYLLTRAPILCLSRPSELTAAVDATGSGRWAVPDDLPAIARALEAALEARAGGPPVSTPRPAQIERFSSPSTAAQLAGLLDRLVASR